jgi:hypothetical protein
VTERQLQDAVVEAMRLQGWFVFHARTSGTGRGWRTAVAYDGAGFPDIVAVRERTLFVEFKVPPNKRTAAQQEWAGRLTGGGADYRVWTPAEWADGTIDGTIAVDRGDR